MRRSTPETAAGVFESTLHELPVSVLSMGFGGCELSPVLGDGFTPGAFWREARSCPARGDDAPGAEFVGRSEPRSC